MKESVFAKGCRTLAALTVLAAVSSASHGVALRESFGEDFSSYHQTGCLDEGTTMGPWTSIFDSYGCNEVRRDRGGNYLRLTPERPHDAEDTGASLVTGPEFNSDLTFEVNVRTARQLRKGGNPNTWEVAWVIWNYTDNEHFYYFIPKADGWELGKRDPAYNGGQRFLGTGSDPFPVGKWHDLRIVQRGNTISVFANGAPITAYTDTERPYSGGKIGFYSEDAEAWFTGVRVEGRATEFAIPPSEDETESRRKGIDGLLGSPMRRRHHRGEDRQQPSAESESRRSKGDAYLAPPPKLGGVMSFSLHRYRARELRRAPFRRLMDDPADD